MRHFFRPSFSRRVAVVSAALIATATLSPLRLWSQQTVINAPSVDQTPKGRVFALHESQLRAWGDTSFWQTTHFVTYGLTKQLEVAVTAYNIGTPLKRVATLGVGWKGAIDMPAWLRVRPSGNSSSAPVRCSPSRCVVSAWGCGAICNPVPEYQVHVPDSWRV
ncbi:MAG: hypothetical protein HEQ38_03510 [Gemmatimonas sp.]|nr:hypothetical protein [Gemmatimonas sp.]